MQFASAASKSVQVIAVLFCAPAACIRRADESRMKELESFMMLLCLCNANVSSVSLCPGGRSFHGGGKNYALDCIADF